MNSHVPANEEQVLAACEQALRLAPREYPPTLPSSKELPGVPEWHPFEHEAWQIGESVRRGFAENPKLKKNNAVLDKVLDVATCCNLRRGRQSFVMALGFVAASHHAKTLIPFFNDPDVSGHVVYTLVKMKASGYARDVEPLLRSERTWIRNLAKKYLSRYALPAS